MATVKDFKIISGLEGNTTDGWYMYLSQGYEVVFQIDIETDSPTPTSKWSIIDSNSAGEFYVTNISSSITEITDGIRITSTVTFELDLANTPAEFFKTHKLGYYCFIILENSINVASTNKIYIPIYATQTNSVMSMRAAKIEVKSIEYSNNKVTKSFLGPNEYVKVDVIYDPALSYTINDVHLSFCEFDEVEWNDSNYIYSIIPIKSTTIQSGWVRIEGILYNDNEDQIANKITSDSTGCIASAYSDFSDSIYVDTFSYIATLEEKGCYSQLYSSDYLSVFVNPTNQSISLGVTYSTNQNSVLSDTTALHIYGNLIAANIADMITRLDMAEAAIQTLQSNFEVEEVASKTYTTKAASTYENVGITIDFEPGNLYALYSTSSNGYVKGMQIRNSNGTIYFDWITNGNRYAAYCLPVCYCRSSVSDYKMYVSRSSTGSNDYKIYKIMTFI